jgi:hypothetical protein
MSKKKRHKKSEEKNDPGIKGQSPIANWLACQLEKPQCQLTW